MNGEIKNVGPAQAVVIAMAAASVALALILTLAADTNIAIPIAIAAVIIYLLSAAVIEHTGKVCMDAAVAASIALAIADVVEAFLISIINWQAPLVVIINRQIPMIIFKALVLLMVMLTPAAASFAVYHIQPEIHNVVFTLDIAMFGLIILMETAAVVLAGHNIFLMAFVLSTTSSHFVYKGTLLSLYVGRYGAQDRR